KGNLLGPVVLKAGEDAGGAGAEAGEAAFGEGEERFGLVDDQAVGAWKLVEDALQQAAGAPPEVDDEGGDRGQETGDSGEEIEDSVLDSGVMGVDDLGGGVLARGRGGGVPAE